VSSVTSQRPAANTSLARETSAPSEKIKIKLDAESPSDTSSEPSSASAGTASGPGVSLLSAAIARARSSEEPSRSGAGPVNGSSSSKTGKSSPNHGSSTAAAADIPSLDQSSAINNALLRKAFRQLTERILNPFEKCFLPEPSSVAPVAYSLAGAHEIDEI